MRRMIKWWLAVVSFIMCFLGLEIYRNTQMMDKGYLLQELKVKKKVLEEENDYLHQKLSPSLSLSRLEEYARENLGLSNPQEVRFLEERLSLPIKSSSPPPFSLKRESWLTQGIKYFKNLWKKLDYLFHEKDK